MVSVFDYLDYRDYLQAYFEEKKRLKPHFSFRYFARLAGFKSPAFVFYVVEGQRNLSSRSLPKMMEPLKLSKDEGRYFENLVNFTQAKTVDEKALYYARLLEIKPPSAIHNVDPLRYEFYAKWYHSVIRELLAIFPFDGTGFQALGRRVKPHISAKEAEHSFELLLRMGFVAVDEAGYYRPTDKVIMAAPEAKDAFVISKFQTEMLKLAIESYNGENATDKISASTTYSISAKTVELFKQRTRNFRRELLEIARLDDEAEKVYQFTFNLFPVSAGGTSDEKN